MKKIIIPTILAATILVAGMFAMMPVQKASTIHSSLASPVAVDGKNVASSYQIRSAAATVNLIPAGETITGRVVVSTLAAGVGGTCELRAAGGANDSIAGVSNIAVDTTGAATVAALSGLDVVVEVALSTCSVGIFLDSTTG